MHVLYFYSVDIVEGVVQVWSIYESSVILA
jgi:hypothetical protein